MGAGSLALAFPVEILDVTFGTDANPVDAYAGFTAVAGSGEWTPGTDAILYSASGVGGNNNSSLLRQFTGSAALSTAAGNSYSFTSVIDSTGAGGNDNNRFAMTLFASGSGSLDSGISVDLNRLGLFQIKKGLNDFGNAEAYTWNTEGGAPIGTSKFTVEALVSFTTTQAIITATLTDSADTPFSHTIPEHAFNLTDLTLGEFFGVSTRNRTDQLSGAEFSMGVESFNAVHVIPEPSTLALLGIALGSVFFFRRRK